MTLFDTILAFFASYSCLDCGAEAGSLCDECKTRRLPAPRICYKCLRRADIGPCSVFRIQQVQGVFSVRSNHHVTGKHIILVDDVLTTGATLEAAARALLQAGAVLVYGAVFAQA